MHPLYISATFYGDYGAWATINSQNQAAHYTNIKCQILHKAWKVKAVFKQWKPPNKKQLSFEVSIHILILTQVNDKWGYVRVTQFILSTATLLLSFPI